MRRCGSWSGGRISRATWWWASMRRKTRHCTRTPMLATATSRRGRTTGDTAASTTTNRRLRVSETTVRVRTFTNRQVAVMLIARLFALGCVFLGAVVIWMTWYATAQWLAWIVVAGCWLAMKELADGIGDAVQMLEGMHRNR